MLTVAVDAAPLLGTPTGIGVAVGGMVRQLAGRADVTTVGYGLTGRGWARLRTALPPGVRSRPVPMPAGPLLRAWQRWDGPPIEWWTGRVDVVHGTNFVVPPARRAARLVSVWDLTPVRYPELCTPTSRRYPGLIERAVAGGAWVHTGAASVAAEIVEHFGVDPDRVRVVAPGVDPAALGEPPLPMSGPPYILGLGTAEPRKDFPGLVAGFDLIAERHPDLELRIAGPPGWGDAALERAIEGAAHRDRIHRLGWVVDSQGLLAGARLLAYPSLYEGFGLPPLEAMALGVPVVATGVGSLPEVLGDAAELVPPGQPEALAAALERVLSDTALRERLIAAGRARVAGYSWAAAGDALVAIYREMAGAGPSS